MTSNTAIGPTTAKSPLTIQSGETRRLSNAEVGALCIRNTARSDHPQFADSIFVTASFPGGYEVTRMPDTVPPMGVAVALDTNQVAALFIHTTHMTSFRPELAGSKFTVRYCGPNAYLVTRYSDPGSASAPPR